MKTLYNQTVCFEALPYDTYTTGANAGTAIDLASYGNYFRSVLFVIVTETITNGTHTFSVSESSNGSDYTALPAWRYQGAAPALTSSDSDGVFAFGVSPTARYVKLTNTVASGANGGPMLAVAVCGEPGQTPPARS